MGKERRKKRNKAINLPALTALILLGAVYFACQHSYYKNGGDVYHLLLSLQFPLIQCIPYEKAESIEIIPAEEEPHGITLELAEKKELPPSVWGDEPAILIYHTHATEAYFKTEDCNYEDNGKWRTLENDKNVIAVGNELAEILQDKYGISVIHDITNHEPPKLATAYSRSVKTMEQYREEYPSIVMYIDLHRDSYGNDPKEIADYVTIDGKECARIMFVVGTGKGATGTGYDEMPDFDSNYALAEYITNKLAEVDEDLVRDIRVKTGRYNQHISNKCLLVEVGHNANTLEQALNSMEYLAAAIAAAGGMSSSASANQLSLSP